MHINNIRFNLPMAVVIIMQILESHKFEACIVGGCVRDIVLGVITNRDLHPNDWDIASNARPQEVMQIFGNNKLFSVIPVGIEHGTVGVLPHFSTCKKPIEITTYRVDGKYSDSRRPDKVNFSLSLKEDLARRDFRINAMACSLVKHQFDSMRLLEMKDEYIICNMQIHDYYNGLESLKQKKIACVGNPSLRFEEDSLRIMRALRFSATLEPRFLIETSTDLALRKLKNKLNLISKERVQTEFNKLLLGNYSTPVLIEYKEIIEIIAPQILELNDSQYEINMKSIQTISEFQESIQLRLSLFLHGIEKEKVLDFLRSLKYDNKTIKILDSMVTLHEKYGIIENPLSRLEIKKILYKFGIDIFSLYVEKNLAMARILDSKNLTESILHTNTIYKDIVEKKECYKLSQLSINGKDVINILQKRGIKCGKMVGEILESTLNFAMEENLRYTDSIKEKLTRQAETLAEQAQHGFFSTKD